jgi:two-component system, chemotaxis family, chemotaxis protein CheY
MGTILIVEDDDDLRELFAEVLRSERHSVVCASNGQEALALLEKMQPCLVLLDMMMPVMSGGELLQKLDRSKRLEDTPIVVVSAIAEQTQAESPGACRYMQKPIELGALLEVAREFCNHSERC